MEMIIDPAEMVQSYIISKEKVSADGPIRELNIYNHDPLELEMMHSGLWFLTNVQDDKRTAKNGQWKRLAGEKPLNSRGGGTIGVFWSYMFVWNGDVNDVKQIKKHGFRMNEYRTDTSQRRTVVQITRMLEKGTGSGRKIGAEKAGKST